MTASRSQRNASGEGAPGGERVLLLEFVNADQLPGRISCLFPLLAGFYREPGDRLRWLRFGLSTTHFLEYGSDTVELPKEETARLLEVVEEFRPQQLLCTDTLSSALRRQIRRIVPGIDFFEAIGSAWSEASFPPRLPANLMACLDRPGFLPRYDWEAGNRAALRREIDNIYLVLRQACGHRLPVAPAPPYAGLRDRRIALHRGCAFCISGCFAARRFPPGRYTTPAVWIRKQLAGIVASRGSRLPNSLLLESLPAPRLLEICLEEMRAAGMETVQIQLGIRTNLAPHLERILRRFFAKHPSSPIRIGVYASGLESFAAEDLRLFNKGTTPLDNLRAVNIYRRLARDFPERFSYYGLSTILFTPWTTLTGLDLNLGTCQAMGLKAQEIGNLFQSRLRLHPWLPLTALAEHQGLVARREPDPLLRMNRRKLFPEERPWRFADRRLKALCRLVLRYDLIDSPLADSLAKKIAERVGRIPWNGHRDELLLQLTRCMIEVLWRFRRPLRPEALLEKSYARWLELRRAPRLPRRIGTERLELGEFVERLAYLVRRNVRQVCSLDDLSGAEQETVAAQLARSGLHSELIASSGSAGEGGTVFFSLRRDVLRRRLELERAMGEAHGAARERAIVAAGSLHGVPACCARAYAKGPFRQVGLEGWAAFARRAERPGRMPALINPFFAPALAFVPCRIDCPQALRSYRATFAALGVRPRSDRVYLCSLDGREYYPLRVRREGEDFLDFEPEPEPTDGILAEALRRGRRLCLAPTQIRIQDGAGQDLLAMTASHGLWWAKRCFFPAEWLELVAGVAWRTARAETVPTYASEPKDEEPAPPPGPGGLALVVLDRAAGGARYVFRVAPFRPESPYLLRLGPWVMWYSHGDLGERARRVARALAQVMRRFLGRELSAASLEPWREALDRELATAGLAADLQWSLFWLENCDAEVGASAEKVSE